MAVTISGECWAYQRRGWRDVIACLAGRHFTAMAGSLPNGMMVRRCTCGATRMGRRGLWMDPENVWRRVSARRSAALIHRDHARKIRMQAVASELASAQLFRSNVVGPSELLSPARCNDPGERRHPRPPADAAAAQVRTKRSAWSACPR